MIFELLHAAMPDGYGEALLPLAQCKAHLGLMAEDTDDDALVAAFRDAAIEFVERYCGLYLGPREGLIWRAERFPASDTAPILLGAGPVTEITAISWTDNAGAPATGDVADYRAFSRGDVLPAWGETWPSDVSGGIEIEFTAGFPDNGCPASLLHAARLFLGHLWINREAIITGTIAEVTPFGVTALCSPFRRITI